VLLASGPSFPMPVNMLLEHGLTKGDLEILCLLMQLGVGRRFGARRAEPASYDGVEFGVGMDESALVITSPRCRPGWRRPP